MFSDRPSIQHFIHSDALAQLRFTPRFFHISSVMSLIATTRLSQLTKPVLVLLAEKDVTADNHATNNALARMRSGLLTKTTLNCHHGMQFEAPEQIVANIASWLQEQGISVHGAH
jgi:pimeloyl-ACP methyl ester carboxylesterase